MSEILNFAEFDAALARARAGINRLNLTNPGDAFLQSISRQLAFVYEWTRGGKRPTDEQIKKLSFGVMASRAVDELDPELAQELYRLANYLDHWK
ncbi:MAG TPA: immunity protein Tsi6 family protein [Candidatus Acidoferrum sp.]